MRILLALILVVTSSANAETIAVTIADSFDWANSTAFYVDAPRSIQTKMSEGVVASRKSNNTECSSGSDPFWLCTSNSFRFFRGISGNGIKQMSGYVCPNENWLKKHKYYPIKELADARCVHARWDAEQQAYYLHWPNA